MSLRLRAVLIAGISLLVLWGLAAAWMVRGVQHNLDHTLDERLAMSARMVGGLLQRSALPTASAIPGSEVQQAVLVGGGEGIACQIRSLRGEILAQTAGAPETVFRAQASGYGAAEIEGEAWRTYTLQDGDYQIVTADRIEERATLTRQMLIATTVPFLIAVIGGLLALWIGIGRGLSPLETLCRTLKEKRANDTRPVDIGKPPAELKPVVRALNELLARLAQMLSSQRAFTDAAAHELRTPLTAIGTHLQVVQLTDGPVAKASLQKAGEGVQRLSRIVNQMMILARTDAATEESGEDYSIGEVVRELIGGLIPAEQARIELDIEEPDGITLIPRAMLEAAIRNLVDNALRYDSARGGVTIRVRCNAEAQQGLIEVADRGPGLRADQIAEVGRRFWRGDQGRSSSEGAGLGLSIVRSIADRFGATLTLSPRDGGGLVAGFLFPVKVSGAG